MVDVNGKVGKGIGNRKMLEWNAWRTEGVEGVDWLEICKRQKEG